MPNPSLEKWSVANCAEFNAVNNALINGAKIGNLDVGTVMVKKGQAFQMCRICQITIFGSLQVQRSEVRSSLTTPSDDEFLQVYKKCRGKTYSMRISQSSNVDYNFIKVSKEEYKISRLDVDLESAAHLAIDAVVGLCTLDIGGSTRRWYFLHRY